MKKLNENYGIESNKDVSIFLDEINTDANSILRSFEKEVRRIYGNSKVRNMNGDYTDDDENLSDVKHIDIMTQIQTDPVDGFSPRDEFKLSSHNNYLIGDMVVYIMIFLDDNIRRYKTDEDVLPEDVKDFYISQDSDCFMSILEQDFGNQIKLSVRSEKLSEPDSLTPKTFSYIVKYDIELLDF